MGKIYSVNDKIVTQIFNALDAKDGKVDKKITNKGVDGKENIWNDFADLGKGNHINIAIEESRARASIASYLNKGGDAVKEAMFSHLGLTVEHTDAPAQPVAKNSPTATATEPVQAEENTDVVPANNGTAPIAKVKEKRSVNDNITYNETVDPGKFSQALDNLVRSKKGANTKSKILGTGNYFHNSAVQNNLDPFVLAAVSIFESGWGLSGNAVNKNNLSGTMKGGKYITYNSVENCIVDSANCLARNSKKHVSLINIAMKGNYCCAEESGRRTWGNSVNSIANALRREYNKLIV